MLLNAPIRQKSDRLLAPEFEQDVHIGNKEHLLDLVQLLEADDSDFAAAGRGLNNEAVLFVVSVALEDHVGGEGHPLDRHHRPLVRMRLVIAFKQLIFFLFDLLALDSALT